MRTRAETRLHDIGRRLAKALEKVSRDRGEIAPREKLEAAFDVIESYERLSGEVYRLRSTRASSKAGEDLLNTTAHEIIGLSPPEPGSESAYRMFIREYRAIWREQFSVFLFAASIFCATAIVGWNLGMNQPDYVSLFVDQGLMEKIQGHDAWFSGLQQSPFFDGLQIALNNIKVATLGFLFGALFGFGSLYILAMNGLSIGAIFGYCRVHGFDSQLMNFVLSHGPLELTIIVASCFAGLLIGRVFYLRPVSLLGKRLRHAGREAGVLSLGIIPWLILAATFEAGVSPMPFFSATTKFTAGLMLAGLFWLWTFVPVPQAKRDDRKSE